MGGNHTPNLAKSTPAEHTCKSTIGEAEGSSNSRDRKWSVPETLTCPLCLFGKSCRLEGGNLRLVEGRGKHARGDNRCRRLRRIASQARSRSENDCSRHKYGQASHQALHLRHGHRTL